MIWPWPKPSAVSDIARTRKFWFEKSCGVTAQVSRSPVAVLPVQPVLPGPLSPQLLLLLADLERLGAVIFDPLFEPRVVESLLGRDPLRWVVNENPLQQIEELQVEVIVRRNGVLRKCQMWSISQRINKTYLQPLHCLDILSRSLGRIRVRIVELLTLEVSFSECY